MCRLLQSLIAFSLGVLLPVCACLCELIQRAGLDKRFTIGSMFVELVDSARHLRFDVLVPLVELMPLVEVEELGCSFDKRWQPQEL